MQEAESLEHELNVMKNRLSKIEPQLKNVTKQRDEYKDQYETVKKRLTALKEEVSYPHCFHSVSLLSLLNTLMLHQKLCF